MTIGNNILRSSTQSFLFRSNSVISLAAGNRKFWIILIRLLLKYRQIHIVYIVCMHFFIRLMFLCLFVTFVHCYIVLWSFDFLCFQQFPCGFSEIWFEWFRICMSKSSVTWSNNEDQISCICIYIVSKSFAIVKVTKEESECSICEFIS